MRAEHHISVEHLSGMQHPSGNIWPGLMATGVFTIALGVVAILLPFIAALTIGAILAAVLIIAAIMHIIHAFQSRESKNLGLQLLTGVLYGLVGILLVAFPLRGVFTLTLFLAMLFMFSGTFKIALSLHMRPRASWGWLLFNGIISLVLGVIIWMGLPGTARWAIGLIVGIELVFSGWAMVMFAVSYRHAGKEAGLHGQDAEGSRKGGM